MKDDKDKCFIYKGKDGKDVKLDMIPWTYWNGIHIRYEKTIRDSVYRKFGKDKHLLDNRLYLRILNDVLIGDLAVKL